MVKKFTAVEIAVDKLGKMKADRGRSPAKIVSFFLNIIAKLIVLRKSGLWKKDMTGRGKKESKKSFLRAFPQDIE